MAPRVLLVDDDRDLVRLQEAALRLHGVEVLHAYDATQGLRLAQREHPDVVVVDMRMPAGGGRLLLERLPAIERTADIRVVVQSACVDAEVEAVARRAGAVAVLEKPVDPAAFVAGITRVLAAAPDGA